MKIGKHNIHLHSMAIHYTLGLYPVAILFLGLSFLFPYDSLRSTYSYLMIVATLSVPFSDATGYLEWKEKYKGALVSIFKRKITFGLIVLGLGIITTVWHAMDPTILETKGLLRGLFLILNFAIVPCVLYLGHLGGKIIFSRSH